MLMANSGVGPSTPAVASYKAVGRRFANTNYGGDSTLNTTTITGANYQITHWSLTNFAFSGPKLVYANRWSDQAAAVSNITVTAYLEYPIGTFHQVLFGGVAQLVLNIGAVDVKSDAVISSVTGQPLIIPAGGVVYREHTYVTGFGLGNGHPIAHARALAASNLDGASFSNGETDKTNQQLTASSNGWYYGAVSMEGNTTCPFAIGLFGDSICANGGDDPTAIDCGYLERSVGGAYGTTNCGQSGETAAHMLTNHTARLRLLTVLVNHTHVWNEPGTNDIAASTNPVSVSSLVQQLNNKFASRGKRILNNTIPPRTTSTNSFIDVANQTIVTNFTGNRDTYNTLVAAGLVFADNCFDVNPTVESVGNHGFWTVNGSPFFATPDGTHPSTAMCILLAAANNIATRVQGPVPLPVPAIFASAGVIYDSATLPVIADGAPVTSWIPSVGTGTLAPSAATPPLYKLMNSPDGNYSSVRFSNAGATNPLTGVVPALDNLSGNPFYILTAVRINTAVGALFNKAGSNNRLLVSSTLQLDLFYNTSANSFQAIPLAGTAGANDWVVIELSVAAGALTTLNYRSAVGSGGANTGTKAASSSGSGGPKTDTGMNFYLGSGSGGTPTIDGDIAFFGLWNTVPSQADQNAAFNWVRGLIGA